jgi:hypothetical protein
MINQNIPHPAWSSISNTAKVEAQKYPIANQSVDRICNKFIILLWYVWFHTSNNKSQVTYLYLI